MGNKKTASPASSLSSAAGVATRWVRQGHAPMDARQMRFADGSSLTGPAPSALITLD